MVLGRADFRQICRLPGAKLQHVLWLGDPLLIISIEKFHSNIHSYNTSSNVSILHVMKKKLKQTLYESNLKLFSFLLFYNVKKVGSFAGTVGSCMYVVTISFGK